MSQQSELKSRKPTNTPFKQQRLPAWQPILTPRTVLPTFFIVGLIFAPIGGLLLYASNMVNEIIIDYSNCGNYPNMNPVPISSFSSSFSTYSDINPRFMSFATPTFLTGPNPNNISITRCAIEFFLPQPLKAPVFLYYRLTNFFQNHRRYVKSFDASQLKGEAVGAGTLDTSCAPLGSNDSVPYYPCGLIANSIFNDTISDFTIVSPGGFVNSTYVFSSTGIAWPTDRAKYGRTAYGIADVRPPPNWALRYPGGNYSSADPAFGLPELNRNEHFMVWMRTSGLPNFRKLWGRQDRVDMPSGVYHVEVEM
ncbi:CDC50/LEM3 family, partial [Jimgerdemannia flammicorona]